MNRLQRIHVILLTAALLLHLSVSLYTILRLKNADTSLNRFYHILTSVFCVIWCINASFCHIRHDLSSQDRKRKVTFAILIGLSSLGIVYLRKPIWEFGLISFLFSALLIALTYSIVISVGFNVVLGLAVGIIAYLLGNYPMILAVILLDFLIISGSFIIETVFKELRTQSRMYDQARWAASKLSSVTLRLDEAVQKEKARAFFNERKRISTLIHDTVGYALTAIIGQLNILYDRVATPNVSEAIAKLEKFVRKTLMETRILVHEMGEHPEDVEEEEWTRKCLELCDVFRDCTGVSVERDIPPLNGIERQVGETVYRIIQEGLTNAYRHGRADYIAVTIKIKEKLELLLLKVSDNGVGCDKYVEGKGLKGMRERIYQVGGSLNLATLPNKGFDIAADIPLNGGRSGHVKNKSAAG